MCFGFANCGGACTRAHVRSANCSGLPIISQVTSLHITGCAQECRIALVKERQRHCCCCCCLDQRCRWIPYRQNGRAANCRRSARPAESCVSRLSLGFVVAGIAADSRSFCLSYEIGKFVRKVKNADKIASEIGERVQCPFPAALRSPETLTDIRSTDKEVE